MRAMPPPPGFPAGRIISIVAIHPFSHHGHCSVLGPIVGTGCLSVCSVCLSVCLSGSSDVLDLSRRVHGCPRHSTQGSTTANRARWIAAVGDGKSKKTGGQHVKRNKKSVQNVPCRCQLVGRQPGRGRWQISGVCLTVEPPKPIEKHPIALAPENSNISASGWVWRAANQLPRPDLTCSLVRPGPSPSHLCSPARIVNLPPFSCSRQPPICRPKGTTTITAAGTINLGQ
jgi:hypothetical protein